MKIISSIILLSLLLSGCAELSTQRIPATTSVQQSQDEILNVFEFKKSKIQNESDYAKMIESFFVTSKYFKGTYSSDNEITIKFIQDNSLPKDVAYFPGFQVEKNRYQINILHSADAIHDTVASAELFNFLKALKKPEFFASHFAPFEMYYNAIEKDPATIQNWAKIRAYAAKIILEDNYSSYGVKDELLSRSEDWLRKKDELQVSVNQDLKEQRKLDLKRRAIIDPLDKAEDADQFKNLVAKNDRKGVATLLKKYLPWEQMAPFEKKFWETYLETIVNPLPMEQRVLIYRGLNDDFIYSAYREGKEIEKELAKKEGDIFVMSTIMTKNQGTWNRRLRSLTAMYEKFIAIDKNKSNEFTKSARMVTMFTNHSLDPKGSPFLSLTPKYLIAKNFGSNKISAYALDPRLISFNFTSAFKHEIEFLTPLMIFPDEVLGYFDSTTVSYTDNNEATMLKKVSEKLERKYGKEKGEEVFLKLKNNTAEYFASTLDFSRYSNSAVTIKKETNLLTKFYKNIFEKKPETLQATDPFSLESSKKSCLDIMTLFWK